LDVYVTCISGIYQSLSEHDVQSEGMLRLKDFVGNLYRENGFEQLHDDVKDLVNEVGRVKSLSIGVNPDHWPSRKTRLRHLLHEKVLIIIVLFPV
ncbi:MAG: hypothetical protein II735_06260, partial [Clostridia bacterium]|nr:hypothetical protein [Clostridia bacterium]